MSLYRNVLFPLLKTLDPEHAHELAIRSLELAQGFAPGRAWLRAIAGDLPDRPVTVCDLTFPNAIGLAAGFDKDVRVARGLALLGFGHIEVGTLTPRPQPGNSRPRIFRLPADRALINRMGFPNGGAAEATQRLRAVSAIPRDWVLGVSLGKQKETPLAEAATDYIEVMRRVFAYADYLAVNISSPNTPGLRELQGKVYLERLLGDLVAERDRLFEGESVCGGEHIRVKPPLLVKIAPDLADAELDEILEAITGAGTDAIIATNTTLAREGLTADPHVGETGGLSGAPLEAASTRIIARIAAATGGRLPIIGVGGVATPDHVRAKLDAGALLVQLYTSLIYEGPSLPGRLARSN